MNVMNAALNKLSLLLIVTTLSLTYLSGNPQQDNQITRHKQTSGMGGVNPQRTRVFDSPPASAPNSLLWKTGRLFTVDTSYLSIYTFGNLPAIPTGAYSSPSRHRFTEPVLAADTVYFSLYVNDGYVFAQDSQTGKDKWRFKDKANSLSAVAVANGHVFFGSSDGTLYALDASTGQEVWKKDQKGDSFYTAAPAAFDNVVLFTSSEGSYQMNVRPDGRLFALEAKTGNQLWSFKTKGVLTAPAAIDSTVIVGDNESNVFAFDLKTGQQRWKFNSSGGSVMQPTISDGAVYFATLDGTLHAVDTATGVERWRSSKGTRVRSSLAVDGSTIYFGGDEKNLYAIDAKSGLVKWEYKTNKQCRPPVVAGGLVYFSSLEGVMYALDSANGQLKWKMANLNPGTSSPLVDQGVLYFLDIDGHLYALR